MAEYIDKNATAEHIDMYAKLLTMGDYRSGMMKAKEILLDQESVDTAPSIPKIIHGTDIVPVVRCKDCLFFTTEKSCCRPEGLIKAREDDFCSYGERRKI